MSKTVGALTVSNSLGVWIYALITVPVVLSQ